MSTVEGSAVTIGDSDCGTTEADSDVASGTVLAESSSGVVDAAVVVWTEAFGSGGI